MKVIVEYIDDDSLIGEEVVHNIKTRYGENAKVQVLPQIQTPEGYLKFGIRELIAIDQIEYHFDYRGGRGYKVELEKLKEAVIDKVKLLFDEVAAEIEEGLD